MMCPTDLLIVFSLTGCCLLLITGDLVSSDENPDVGHDEDVHPHVLAETHAEAPNMNLDAWDTSPETTRNGNEDSWRPPPAVVSRDAPPVMHHGNTDKTSASTSSAQCGEYSSQLTANGRCRLTAVLPPVGRLRRSCPDLLLCADDASYWLQEKQSGEGQLEEVGEMMSELQEELRNQRPRVRALEEQVEDSVGVNLTVDQRLHVLERRRSKANTLLHVHATLLDELQVKLHNLSATVRDPSHNTRCAVNRTPPSIGARDPPPPGGRHLSLCPSDCASLYHSGVRRSGLYAIDLSPGATAMVYCDMETEGGGWTVFQRRRDGAVTFNRGWSEYRDGFGDPAGEHWLGNQHLHVLSNQGPHSLRIDLQDWTHTHRHALYNNFRTDSEENQFRLHVSGFSGTVEDSFAWYHDQRGFSTPDTGNICAEISHSGWWFHQCFYANLNGVYYRGGHYTLKVNNLLGPDGIVWFSWKDSDLYSLKTITMMIRPRNFRPSRLSP